MTGRNDPCPCGSGRKYKKCCLVKEEIIAAVKNQKPSTIAPYRAWRFTFRIGFPGKQYKICTFVFNKDGSILITFPYFRNSSGLVSVCTHHPGTTTLNLGETGKVTSHIVKFMHHERGEAHFSLTDKVKNDIHKNSTPLKDLNGHFATLQFQGLSGFNYQEHATTEAVINQKNQILTIRDDEAKDNKAYKLLFYHYNLEKLYPHLRGPVAGPLLNMQLEDGGTQLNWMLSPPLGTAFEERIILLSCKEIPLMSPDPEPFVTLIGGFDHHHSPDQPTQFLSMLYPCSNFEKLRDKIGCIDIEKEQTVVSQ